MNEELLKLGYSKLKTEKSYEQYKIDMQNNEELRALVFSKFKTDKSYDEFVSDLSFEPLEEEVSDNMGKTEAVVVEDAITPAITDLASENGSSESQEDNTLLEDTFGKNGFTNALGDLWRAGAQGFAQSNIVDPSMDLMVAGAESSDKGIYKWIKQNQELNKNQKIQDEMASWDKDVDKNGGGVYGILMATIQNPGIAMPVMVSSMATMIGSLQSEEVSSIAATGVAGGGALGLAGGPLAPATVPVGMATGGFAALSGTMEAVLTFNELLQEEIDGELTPEKVKSILSNPEKLSVLRQKAIARGAVIGAVDLLTAGIAGKFTSTILKKAVPLGKTVLSRSATKASSVTGGVLIEGAGGGVGEASARAVIGQEMDAKEIALEVIGEFGGAGFSVLPNAYGNLKTVSGRVQANKTAKDGGYKNASSVFNPNTDIDEATITLAANKNTSNLIDEQVEIEVANGRMTQEESIAIKENFRSTQGAVNTANKIDRITSDNKPEAVKLLIEEAKLKDKIKDVDNASLTKTESERLKEVQAKLENVGNASEVTEEKQVAIEPKKYTTTTKEKFGSINRADNKGNVNLSESEFKEELSKFEESQKETSGETETTEQQPTDVSSARQDNEQEVDFAYVPKADKDRISNTKAVNKNGKPLKLYHGTKSNFNGFSDEMLGSNTKSASAALGHFFTPNINTAKYYASPNAIGLGGFKFGGSSINPNKNEAYSVLTKEEQLEVDAEYKDYYDNNYKPLMDEMNKSFDEASDLNKKYDNKKDEIRRQSVIKKLREFINKAFLGGYVKLSEELNSILNLLSSKTEESKDLTKKWKEAREVLNKLYKKKESGIVDVNELNIPDESSIKEVVLDMKNPLIFDQKFNESRDETFFDIIEKAKDNGHDGVIINNTYDPNPTDVYVVFNNSQIVELDNSKDGEKPKVSKQQPTDSDGARQDNGEEVGQAILSKSIDISDGSGRKGLVPVTELESFVGEDRVGDAAMSNSRETIDKLKEDIKKSGFKEPIVVLYDKFSNGGEATIIEGNHRYIAAKELGLTEIPVRFEKGNIRSNEKRAKDQMFPLNRKPIGKINDTRGVKGSDLGLTVREATDSDFVGEAVKQTKIEELRQQEQEELLEAIPNAENYLTDGKVDKEKITNPEDIAKFEEVYNKYDKLISPLLETTTTEESTEVDTGKSAVKDSELDTPLTEMELEIISKDQDKSKELESINESVKIIDDKISKLEEESNETEGVDPDRIILENIGKVDTESAKKETGGKVGIKGDVRLEWVKKGESSIESRADEIYDEFFYESRPVEFAQEIRAKIIDFIKGSRKEQLEQYTKAQEIKDLKASKRELNISKRELLNKVAVTVDSETEGLSLTERFKQGFEEFVSAVKNNKRKSRESFKSKIKEGKSTRGEIIKDLNEKRKDLAGKISELKKKGKITTNQAKVIINKVSSVNLYNDKSVDSFISYAEKVYNNADYAKKVVDSDSLKRNIKTLSKNKKLDPVLGRLGKSFQNISIGLIDNIDEYAAIAAGVKEGLTSSKVKGTGVNWSGAVSISETEAYIESQIKKQEAIILENKRQEYEDIMGAEASNMSYDEMMSILNDPEENNIDKSKEKLIRGNIQKVFDSHKAIINKTISTGVDPFSLSKEKISLPNKNIIKRFMNMKILDMGIRDAIRAVDALNNYMVNGLTSGMEGVVSVYEGNNNTKELVNKGAKAIPLKLFGSKAVGRVSGQEITTLPLLFERMFKSQNIARKVMKAIGLDGIVKGKAGAIKETALIVDSYLDKFNKKTPNGKSFNDSSNIIERGMIGFSRRTVMGSESSVKEEFKRRKDLIKESISVLKNGTSKEKAKGVEYQSVYDKILKDAESIENVDANADKINLDAAKWWGGKFSGYYSEMASVSLNIYNDILDLSVNYNPDSYTSTEGKRIQKEEFEWGESAMSSAQPSLVQKKSGTLEAVKRPTRLSKNTYISLDFDTNNAAILKAALVDIRTAGDIQVLKGALTSDSFSKLVPSKEDRDVLESRLKGYVRNTRGKDLVSSKMNKDLREALNLVASLGVSRVLGGITQPLKQMGPVAVNTLINSGRLDLGAIFNVDFNKWIDQSNYSIASRGFASDTTLDNINRALEKEAKSTGRKVFIGIEKVNKMWLETFLVKPDAAIARSSWQSYYKQSLKKQGLEYEGIDWSNHKDNKIAGAYAEQQVNRQQNVSDSDLQGDFMTSKNPWIAVTRKVVIPFQNFVLNQKQRMYSDAIILTSKTSSSQDKKAAARSLAGLAGEMTTYYGIRISISLLLFEATALMMGYDESDEEEEKRIKNLNRGVATSIATDFSSPLPLTDIPTKGLINMGLSLAQKDVPEKEQFQLYNFTKKEHLESLGILGMGARSVLDLKELSEMAYTGKYTSEYMGVKSIKTIPTESQDALKLMVLPAAAFTIGYGPSEFGSIIRYAKKIAKKQSKTDNQMKSEGESSGRNSRSRFREIERPRNN